MRKKRLTLVESLIQGHLTKICRTWFFFFFLIWLYQVLVVAYGILVPGSEIKPRHPALGAWSLSCWAKGLPWWDLVFNLDLPDSKACLTPSLYSGVGLGTKRLWWLIFPSPRSIVTESGVWLLTTQKPKNREARFVERKLCFILGAGHRGFVGADICPKAGVHHWQSVGWSFYRQREGAAYRNCTVSSDIHLEIGHRWSEQCHLGCPKYS